MPPRAKKASTKSTRDTSPSPLDGVTKSPTKMNISVKFDADKKFRPSTTTSDVVEISDSEKDDGERSMDAEDEYVGTKIPSTVATKRGAPVSTPPMKTRGVRENYKALIDSGVVGETDVEEASPPPRIKRQVENNKKKRSLPSDVDTSEDDLPASIIPKGKQAKLKIEHESPSDEETFGGMTSIGMKTTDQSEQPTSKEKEVEYLDTDRRVVSLPKVCEVHSEDAEDPLIKKHGGYIGLPALKYVEAIPIKNYNTGGGPGLITFNAWGEFTPNLRVKSALKTVMFGMEGRYINPSRVDPRDVIGRSSSANGLSVELCVKDGTRGIVTAVLVSPMAITESNTLFQNSNINAFAISGIFHNGEFQRFSALLGMIMNCDTVHLRIFKDAITFSNFSRADAGYGAGSEDIISKIANPASSPSKSKAMKAGAKGGYLQPLSADDKIPVYNAINKSLDFGSDLFDNLESVLPRLGREARRGSFGIVGYTCNLQRGSGGIVTAYFKPRWALVLSEPGK